jgi:excisionase family DNA binding protein
MSVKLGGKAPAGTDHPSQAHRSVPRPRLWDGGTGETDTPINRAGRLHQLSRAAQLRRRHSHSPDLHHHVQRKEMIMGADSEPRLLLRVDQAGRQLNLGRTVMYELIRSGRLRSVKIGRLRLIPASAVAEFVEALDQGAA